MKARIAQALRYYGPPVALIALTVAAYALFSIHFVLTK